MIKQVGDQVKVYCDTCSKMLLSDKCTILPITEGSEGRNVTVACDDCFKADKGFGYCEICNEAAYLKGKEHGARGNVVHICDSCYSDLTGE